MTEDSLKGREVFIEFHSIGQFVKVTAMDTASMTEISIQGSAAGQQPEWGRIQIRGRKLQDIDAFGFLKKTPAFLY